MKSMRNVVAVAAALFVVMEIQIAGAAEAIVRSGVFHDGPPGHTVSGSVRLIRLDGGSYELRLGDDFKSTNGPDLFIYLSAAGDPKDDATVAGNAFLDAGKLNSPAGAQSFSLPGDFDPDKFNSVAVWCKQFSVLFGAAPLLSQ